MPTSERTIPNKALTGSDVAGLTIHEVRELIDRASGHLFTILEGQMGANAVLSRHYGHPGVRIEVDVKFHFANIHMPPAELHAAFAEGMKPERLINNEEAEHFVEGTHREIAVDNPNAARQRADIPVLLTETKKADPGEMFGTTTEHKVPVTGSPEKPLVPVDTDTSDQVAKDKGVAPDRRRRWS